MWCGIEGTLRSAQYCHTFSGVHRPEGVRRDIRVILGLTFSTGLRDVEQTAVVFFARWKWLRFLGFISLIFKYEQTVQLHATYKRPYGMWN